MLLLAFGEVEGRAQDFAREEPSLPVKDHGLPFERGTWHGQRYPTDKHNGSGFVDDVEVRLTWKYTGKRSGFVIVKRKEGPFPLTSGRHPFVITHGTNHVFRLGSRTVTIFDSPIRNQQCVIVRDSGRAGYYCLYSPMTWKN